VWGSEEQLQAERERREEERAKAKVKKYNKQLKGMNKKLMNCTMENCGHPFVWKDVFSFIH
jgi:hypothetical protein